MTLVVALLVSAGLALALLAWVAQGRLLSRPSRRPRFPQGISVLKPVRGADPGLAENLESFFSQDHPEYELVFAVADADDPGADVVREVMSRHPGFPARLVASAVEVGINPKVNNLANAARAARHELLLVSDSNVRVDAGYLSEMAAHEASGASLVTSLIRGSGESGLGGRLEALQLNTFVMGGVAAWAGLFGKPCVVGKSMLIRRSTLAELGGWRFLGQYLAEDQVCGEEVAARRGRIAVSGRPVDNRLGRLSLAAFCARHLRWARLRRRLTLAGYAAEVLLNPVGLALAGLAAVPGAASASMAGLAWLAMTLMAVAGERRLGVDRPLWQVPLLELLRAVLVLLLWPVPCFSTGVTWRGRRFRIGPRTRLLTELPSESGPLPMAASAMETST